MFLVAMRVSDEFQQISPWCVPAMISDFRFFLFALFTNPTMIKLQHQQGKYSLQKEKMCH